MTSELMTCKHTILQHILLCQFFLIPTHDGNILLYRVSHLLTLQNCRNFPEVDAAKLECKLVSTIAILNTLQR